MLKEALAHFQARHEQALLRYIETATFPAQRIKEAMMHSLFPGGKRLRPMLVYLTGELMGVSSRLLDPIAAAVELIHCYSLIHDDLPAMDDDDLRRGKPSCHRAFDEATAILAGDGMQAFAIELLLTHLRSLCAPDKILQITWELTHACGPEGMVSGQCLDLTELAQSTINEAQLAHIHQLKTGQLISACIKMVLAATTPTLASSQALKSFAHFFGLVFQMHDDYSDRYEIEKLGKGRSSDVVNNKITYASLYSQMALKQRINHYLDEAIQSLQPFGHKSRRLKEYTLSLIHLPEN